MSIIFLVDYNMIKSREYYRLLCYHVILMFEYSILRLI